MDRNNIADIYRLTPLQEGMLFHCLQTPQAAVYVEQAIYRLPNVNPSLCQRAWDIVMADQPMLRTNFAYEGLDKPLQVVHRVVSCPIELVDFTALEATTARRQAESLLVSDRETPFDLRQPPLMRLKLIRLNSQESLFAWTFHHILLDGWSAFLIVGKLISAYAALEQGQPYRPKPAPSFKAYLRWLATRDHEAARVFWRDHLAGFTAATPLGLFERSADKYNPAAHRVIRRVLAEDLVTHLTAWSRRTHLTLGTVSIAAWGFLLSIYSGQRDVVFGSAVSGRPADMTDADAMVGLFINTLPVRVRTEADEPIEDWLRRLQQAQMHLREYEYCSLVDIQGVSEVPRGTPMFHSMLNVELVPAGGTVGTLDVQMTEHINFPLTLVIEPGDGTIAVRAQFNPTQYECEAIERLLSHYETVLRQLIENTTGLLCDISLLDAVQRRALCKLHDKAHPYPLALGIDQLIANQVATNAERCALRWGDEQLTYRQLQNQTNRLANGLLEAGVRSGEVVPILFVPSADVIVAMLALVKLGCAYAPLSTEVPSARLKSMVCELGAKRLLAHRGFGANFGTTEFTVLDYETIAASSGDIALRVEPADSQALFYVMHTSGSTGTPKAAAVYHYSYVNLVLSWIEEFGFGPGDTTLLTNRLSHDLSQKSVWITLASGGTLVVWEGAFDPQGIVDMSAKQGVTWLSLTPSMAYLLVDRDAGSWDKLQSVRLLFVGGEPLHKQRLHAWAASAQFKTEFVTTYGPTETTDVSHWYRFTREELLDEHFPVPVGYSLPNLQTYVVDRHGNPLPCGVQGEIVLGGIPVGCGYLNHSAVTAERFLPDSVSMTPGARWYRTGDLGYLRDDGVLFVTGRMDFQIKLRGFRIDPAEIDTVVRSHPAVRDCITLLRSDQSQELVTYWIAKTEIAHPNVLQRALAEHCRAQLPHYMIPSAFVALPAMPLNANGKIDRAALPVPDRRDRLVDDVIVPPRDEVEQRLHRLWSELLANADFGVEDSFFALGGHSLLLTQLYSRIPKLFDVQLPLSTLFLQPTIAAQAREIHQLQGGGERAVVIELQQRPSHLPLSHAQQRLWFLHQYAPESAAYNVPTAIPFETPVDPAALSAALNDVCMRHESLRSRFPMIDGAPYQEVLAAPQFDYEQLDLDATDTRASEQAAEFTARAVASPFDLASRPPLRANLLCERDGSGTLLLILHHIITDGWSTEILLRDLRKAYAARRQGQAPSWLSLPIQYADYALWQRERLSGKRLAHLFDYWRARLGNSNNTLSLPYDYARPSQLDDKGGVVHHTVVGQTLAHAKAVVQARGVSLFVLLGTAFGALMYRLSGQADFNVGSPVANRHISPSEDIVGCFVNTLVWRYQIEQTTTFNELLREFETQARAGQDHQELPFELLVEHLKPTRQPGLQPLFQVMFTLRMTYENVGLIDQDHWVARFDLQASFAETEAGLSGAWEYRRSVFREQTVVGFAQVFDQLLGSALQNPDLPLGALPLLAAERAAAEGAILSPTASPVPVQSIEALFTEIAAVAPARTALLCDGEQLTYGELNRRANQLAHTLRQYGVGINEHVGVSLPRGFDLVVTLLGILKAGAAYVPLDPSYPAERLRLIAEDAGLHWMVTDATGADHWQNATRLNIVNLDDLTTSKALGAQPVTEPLLPPLQNSERVAYLVYTSGTTGKPKGVVALHQGVVRLVKGDHPYVLDEKTIMLQCAPTAFDASTWELWGPLLNGGQVAIYAQKHVDFAMLTTLIEQTRANTAFLTTALFHQWVAQLPGPTPLRCLLAGGEVVSPAAVARLYACDSEVKAYNVYGPTENTTYSTCAEIPRDFDPAVALPIGRSIDHSSAYVLDEALQPVPIGVVGELYVGGTGLALGYHGRPDLTAEKFVANPFGGPGERLYRTGDRVRRRSDGQFDFVGRDDLQVKLRGFRIELGEIENTLLRHAQVKECAVVMIEREPLGKQLIAYVSGHDAAEPLTADTLRRHVARSLPEYMVPQAWIVLPSLPLNANGKIDRSKLPAADLVTETGHREPPENEWEARILAIWEDLLGRSDLSVTDDFFAVGGHSLLAARAVAAMRSEFNMALPLQIFFVEPTIRALARYCELAQWHSQDKPQDLAIQDDTLEVGTL